jgi:hypothetical protein
LAFVSIPTLHTLPKETRPAVVFELDLMTCEYLILDDLFPLFGAKTLFDVNFNNGQK